MLVIIARGTKSEPRLRSLWLGLPAWLVLSSIATGASGASGALGASEGERAFALEWTAPAECPDEATVDGYVEADIGATAYGPAAVRARGSVSAAAEGRYSVDLEIALDAASAQPSKRHLVGSNCEAVSQASALLVALAIRAQAAPAPAPIAPVTRVTPQRESTTPSHARPFLAAGVLTDVGTLPSPTLGVGVSGGATWSILRLEPAVAYFVNQSGHVAGSPGLGARFALGTASARACVPFPGSRWWVAPCVGGGVDWVRASGFGASTPHNASTVDAAVTAAALGGWDISPMISLRLELGAALPLARPWFEVDGAGDVYRRARVGMRSALGLELHF